MAPIYSHDRRRGAFKHTLEGCNRKLRPQAATAKNDHVAPKYLLNSVISTPYLICCEYLTQKYAFVLYKIIKKVQPKVQNSLQKIM